MSDSPNEWAKRTFDSSDVRREAQYSAATESANVALKALLILNGGACLALLAFLANVVDKDIQSASTEKLVTSVVLSLKYFAYGACCAVVASGLAYLVNRFYAESLGAKTFSFTYPFVLKSAASERWRKIADALNYLCVTLFFLAIGLFLFALKKLGG